MSLGTFFTLSAIGWIVGAIVVVVVALYYLKRRGVLKAAKDAAVDAIKQDAGKL